MAAAREMQRRATLPAPPVQKQQRARAPWSASHLPGSPQQSRTSSPPHKSPLPPEPPRSDFQPLHHRRPSQQARQNASYGRIRPQENRPPPPRQNGWQAPPHAKQHGPQRQQPPPSRQSPPPKNRAHREEPHPPPTPPPPAMPPFSELFSMLGGFGNMGGKGAPEPSPAGHTSFETAPLGDDSLDSIMMMVLLLLLKKENADQGLMMALMYIMM